MDNTFKKRLNKKVHDDSMTILRIDHNKPQKKKSKKQREIVWFNKSFTCTEFERGRTKLYSELFYCSQQRLLH